METSNETGTRLDEALEQLGYSVTEGPAEGVFKIATPDGTDAGELTLSDCWAFLRARHRTLFESNPPIWDEERYGPFRLEFTGFCPVCGYGTFNGRHACPGE